jgi:hypothetical protein
MPQTLAAAIVLLAFLAGPARAQEPRMVPVTVDGERVRLEMRLTRPRRPGRRRPEFGGHYIWKRPDRGAPLVEAYLSGLSLPSAVK